MSVTEFINIGLLPDDGLIAQSNPECNPSATLNNVL